MTAHDFSPMKVHFIPVESNIIYYGPCGEICRSFKQYLLVNADSFCGVNSSGICCSLRDLMHFLLSLNPLLMPIHPIKLLAYINFYHTSSFKVLMLVYVFLSAKLFLFNWKWYHHMSLLHLSKYVLHNNIKTIISDLI